MNKETTITQAMAEIKTLGKRIAKKREFIAGNILRPEVVKDPLHSQGGSSEVIRRELQAISDMQQEIVSIRAAIQRANRDTVVTLADKSMSIADWLTWRKEVLPLEKNFLEQVSRGISTQRQNMLRDGKGGRVVSDGETAKLTDVVVNLDETRLARDIENIEAVESQLDGILSHRNATVTVSYESKS